MGMAQGILDAIEKFCEWFPSSSVDETTCPHTHWETLDSYCTDKHFLATCCKRCGLLSSKPNPNVKYRTDEELDHDLNVKTKFTWM
jgi:hypothetical protein